ncbi:FecR domain-containing protein [Pirellulales bacterium]|nr:FecR domain-containing protein [Pirellulales bacterium]
MGRDHHKLAQILARLMEGRATEEDRRTLDALLKEEPKLVSYYVDQCVVESLLAWRLTPSHKSSIIPETNGALQGFAIASRRLQTSLRKTSIGSWGAVLVVAATIALALMIVHEPQSATMIATVTREDALAWVVDRRPDLQGERLASGVVAARNGTFGFTLDSGVEVICEAPFELSLVDPMRIDLRDGRLRAKVPPHATGFVVETPDTRLVDYGTEFGIDASQKGGTSVFVFDGQVDVQLKGNAAPLSNKRLVRGESLRMRASRGSMERVVQIVSKNSPLGWSCDLGEALISASDNIRSPDSLKYYEVVPGGFSEDVLAWVDRPYEWNGVDEGGIPEFLLGADYIKTFIDDRYTKNIQITITVSEPVELYVLLDDRAAPPLWLRRDFTDTGELVGLDEKATSFYPEGGSLGVGPGNSVDRTFHVWRRIVPEPVDVILGGVTRFSGRGEGTYSMYGVAAKRLSADSPE